ncbi:hypothetical protein HD553DRAFT_252736, partial [Filobasidium floriforme]|uniref:uncharacterized protein n=1 Tax=Filobasidium floriforme TaxID=5210 RepID=UPI001E8D17DD
LAAKKLVGVVAHSHKKHPCHQCRITKAEINTPKAYDWRNLESFEPSTLLKRAFEYERATPERKAAIEEEYGVRFSPLLRLQGMEHAGSSPVDPLHNSFLGIAKAFVNMLFKHDIFSEEEDRQVFMAVFEKACYPGHLGRLPSRITKQFASDRRLAGSGLKADQWKRIIQVLPIALFVALRDPENDQIDDVDQEPIDFQAREPTPLPNGRARKRKRQSDVRRNSREWYRVAIMICSALSTLHSHTISIREAMSAVDDLAGASTAILAMGETLTINWHIAMHYVDAVRRFGPLSGFATWAFERNNGALSRVKHNGQERDVPSTLLRSW